MSILLGIHHALDLSLGEGQDWVRIAAATWVAAAFGAGVGLIIVCTRALLRTPSSSEDQARAEDTLRLHRPRPVTPMEDAASPSVVVESQASPVVEVVPPANGASLSIPARPPHPGTLYGMMGRVRARPAGEAWLKEYMERLRSFLPGLEWEGEEPTPPPRLVKALPWRTGSPDGTSRSFVPGVVKLGKRSPDVTAKMDTGTLDRMVQDLVEPEPATLLVPDMPTLSLDMPALPVDATIKTAALTLVEAESSLAPTTRVHAEDPHKTLIAGSNALAVTPRLRGTGPFEYGARRS
jgi:hypothetical protein